MFFGFFAVCIGRASAFGRLLLRLRLALILYIIFGGGYGLFLRGGGSLGALAAIGFGLLGGLLVRGLLRGSLAGGGRLLGCGCLGGSSSAAGAGVSVAFCSSKMASAAAGSVSGVSSAAKAAAGICPAKMARHSKKLSSRFFMGISSVVQKSVKVGLKPRCRPVLHPGQTVLAQVYYKSPGVKCH